MCGICGIVGRVERTTLERMTALLRHRGPDDDGFHVADGVGLGCRRLSIIDVAGGHMPIYNEDGTKCVVQNGEIFNYRELMETLRQKGHVFRTVSDTEAIIHAFEEYGEDVWSHLNGDFAVAIWDAPTHTLHLARDRFGVHPLYYAEVGGALFFSSEIKSLLVDARVPRELDPAAIDQYLTLRYVPEGRTLFRHIRKLPPACWLRFRDGRAETRRYWQLPERDLSAPSPEFTAAAEELDALLADSVRLRMRSDVPVGAYLSGGLDSSEVVGLMTRFTAQPIKTFCIGFGLDIDELGESRALAKLFRADHHEIVVGKRDFELLPKIVWHLDEPIGDAIVIPTYRLAQAAAREVKVVLSGEGADEVWGGYIHQLTINTGNRVPLPRLAARIVRGLPASWLDAVFPYPAALGERGKETLASYLDAVGTLDQEYLTLASVFKAEDKRLLYTDSFRATLTAPDFTSALRGNGDRLRRVIDFDMANWLPDYTLIKQDKLGFGNSLEIRVPYLDHRIAEFAARLPSHFKIKGTTTKRLLREAATRVVPKRNAWARKKAFYIPVERVFGAEFDHYVRDVLGSQRCRERGIIAPEYLRRRLADVRTTELLSNKQIVALTILELWFRTFVDGTGQTPIDSVPATR